MSEQRKFAKAYKTDLKKRAPKGVNPEKHERCVQSVKEQGRSVGSAHAICTASMKKNDVITMPKDEFVEEHKRLISTLESPSRKDDKVEAKHQRKELNQYTKKDRDPKKFAKEKKIKKSIDFQNSLVSIDASDQLLAEKTASKELIDYIKASLTNEISKIHFSKGILVLNEKDRGLFNGFFTDESGQVVEKFDNQTVELIAKNMELKGLYSAPVSEEPAPSVPSHDEVEELEDRIIARQEADQIMAEHNAQYHQGQAPGEPIGSKKGYLRIKYGDFEIELKKSVRDFVSDFKKAKTIDKNQVKKALLSWKKKYDVLKSQDLTNTAKYLFDNWQDYSEEFNQVLFAIQQESNE